MANVIEVQRGDVNESLMQLYRTHEGKVSDKWSSYLKLYDSILRGRRLELRSLLEIGVQNGGSLEIWAKYFPNAEHIVGCDIDERCRALTYSDLRIRVFVGDATQSATCAAIASHSPSFDVVIEDGSHIPKDVIAAFLLYWPQVKPGGMFIAEDLHCDYFPSHQGSIRRRDTANRFFMSLTQLVNYEHWQGVVPPVSLFGDFPTVTASIAQGWTDSIAAISFHNSVVVIHKALEARDTELGPRFPAGQIALVDDQLLRMQGNVSLGLEGLREKPAPVANPTSFAQMFKS
jgi:predicted O-methyltransferase YrrM